ncbi:pentapeptide repeat-containing protein [Gemelliphila palaticanis]|uniref:Pentapeptide repeat-containing protein n=1 Tax=Gemelliphila palaticanis TaxID=81950 RepID=A0ABX2SWZ9_9BACL|nr:pentapeptide repeat-containing protein [Gemella palaticanis]MBF0714785.1 pentapeptide repeat-containing protein [Gemella palaticanis]NYS46715.1 pentapeptide repeat-containing protein [Gemella palaticanis]
MEYINKENFLNNNKKIYYQKIFEKMNLSNHNLDNYKFYYCDLSNVFLENCSMQNIALENCLLDGTSLKNSNLKNANLKSASLRRVNLENCNLEGAYLYSAILENANLKNIKTNDKTKWFRLRCPEVGSFIGYKKCLDNRLVTLYIPEDALRTSSTLNTCRCNKAKVLKITNFEETISYDEAWSYVDENFSYKVGEWIFIKNFNQDRWFDSTIGIHFWMTKKEAMKY